MATTITQARPLLNAAELQLFSDSRAEPIKALALARVHAKVARTRALRDKYRDLYRRQTVAVRAAPARTRAPAGNPNERTQRKADIFQEVLERYESRATLLETRAASAIARGDGPVAKAKTPVKSGTKKKATTSTARSALRQGLTSTSAQDGMRVKVSRAVPRGKKKAATPSAAVTRTAAASPKSTAVVATKAAKKSAGVPLKPRSVAPAGARKARPASNSSAPTPVGIQAKGRATKSTPQSAAATQSTRKKAAPQRRGQTGK